MEHTKHRKVTVCLTLIALVLAFSHAAHAISETGTTLPSKEMKGDNLASTPASPSAQDDAATAALGNLLGTVAVPETADQLFNGVYERNEEEIRRILSENPFLLWQTVSLVVAALPALSLINEQEGRLCLDDLTYSKANTLYDEYKRLASARFSADLEQAKRYVDQRTERGRSGEILIDLNE